MKLLIVRVGAFGDVLHALPAAAALKHLRPDISIDWIIDNRWHALLTDDAYPGPIVRRSIVADTRAWKSHPFAATTLRSIAAFRKLSGQYDAVVDLQGTMRSALLARLAAKRGTLSGYADPREPLAAHLYFRKLERRNLHVVEQGAALLGDALGLDLTPRPFTLPLIDRAEHWAEHEAVLGRPLALLAPGAGWAAKQWPVDRFADVAIALRDRGFDVVVNAARPDSPDALRIRDRSHGAARIIASDIAGLVALMRRADLVIGNDSGPTHLAAALAVPTVALFGPTDPARNGPWGPGKKIILRDPASPTTYKRTSAPDPGLLRITADDVLDAAATLALRQ